jgi:hypothetical protein
MKGPDFDELVGQGLAPEERARLRRVHDALVAAGPPPDLPDRLGTVPVGHAAARMRSPRRRLATSLALAAVLASAAFGLGVAIADRDDGPAFETDFVLAMKGTPAAPDAEASLLVGAKDDDGNWPMKMTVRGLDPLPAGEHYELVLTKGGKPAASCGTFWIESAATVVYLNAPHLLKRYDGWAITRERSDEILVRTEDI